MLQESFAHIWLPYTQMKQADLPFMVKKTKASHIILEDGTKLLDGIASWWSVAHGYNHPHIQKALKKQLKSLSHIMFAGLANKPAYELAKRLIKFVQNDNAKKSLHLNRVFYSDSGSTAVEVALKIALQYFINNGQEHKTKIIAFYNSYHGDTLGGMSLSDTKNGMHAKFSKLLPKQLITKIPENQRELDDFVKFITKNHAKTAALIIEPLIQCAGGMKFHKPEILTEIVKICQQNNILTIFDECAVGFYRTGKKFAFHHTNITPDILLVGKALTGGFLTLAATITTEKIYKAFLADSLDKALMHGPTFMGNALACSAANASLDLFEQNNYQQKVANIANIFSQELAILHSHPNVKAIRICGALAAIEFKEITWAEILTLRAKLVKAKIWLRPFANILYFMPALTIKPQELRKLIKTTIKIL
ncbi:MAG: adenosylmethionine--8-amino-7-oxononanoate transaminase [Rickettsiales bacterium]